MEKAALVEIGKFTRLAIVWLGIIFGATWASCWLVGVALPEIIEKGMGGGDVALAWANVFRLLTPVAAIVVFIPINAMFMVLAERRALALFTMRKGPNRVGPDGLAQTAADALKLLFKEDITPAGADSFMFTLAPILFFAPSIIGVIPLLAAITNNHKLFAVANLPTGIFFVLAVSSIPVVGIVMGAWASNNKYSLVGGLRSAAQAVSYEIPLVLAIITVCVMAGSLDVVQIVRHQHEVMLNGARADCGIWGWNVFGGGLVVQWVQELIQGRLMADVSGLFAASSSALETAIAVLLAFLRIISGPALLICCLLLFLVYITGACAEVNRIPFDLPEAESELVSGYNTEYSGIKFAIFFLAEFTNLFVVSSIATVMFLGGGYGPIPWVDAQLIGLLNQGLNQLNPGFGFGWLLHSLIDPPTLVAVFWVVLKTYALVIFAILVRATLPRFRIDQLMDFGWKRLIPLSLI
ncbi:MAG: NADH-quinone oxidoreductase subunit H, partial [Candidatus Melainabacteria bacterium]|nr:NADH-quinone oxidoreductase subunit H [Candidatus Melainabacteria bacterium]